MFLKILYCNFLRDADKSTENNLVIISGHWAKISLDFENRKNKKTFSLLECFTIVISVAKNKIVPTEHRGLQVGKHASYSKR
jgi:hypothetical protein